MKKHIAEDLPARSHPQAALSSNKGQNGNQNKSKPFGGGKADKKEGPAGEGGKTPEQRVRQAVYDIRYRARRENLPLRTAYAQYMQNSTMSEMEKAEVREKLFGKEGSSGGDSGGKDGGKGADMKNESYEIKEFASESMAKALYKVFVDNQPKITEEYIDDLRNTFREAAEGSEHKKYKVRVTDKQSGVTYYRYANRAKISQLRARGLDVEMSGGYGDAYEGERENKEGKGPQKKSRDRSRAQKDYDGDGKVESGAKEHAGAVHNAIQRKRGGIPNGKDTSNVKESYMSEVLGMANLPQMDSAKYVNPDSNQQVIDVLPPERKNKVTVNPQSSIMAHTELKGDLIYENGYGKFLNLLYEKKMTKAKKAKEKKLKQKYDASSMKQNMEKEYGAEKGKKIYFAKIRKEAVKEECGCDESSKKPKRDEVEQRGAETALNNVKNKFRSMGAKKVIIDDSEA